VPWAHLISIAVRNMKAVFVFWMDCTESRGISMKVRGTPEKKQMHLACTYLPNCYNFSMRKGTGAGTSGRESLLSCRMRRQTLR
jgi:hypothetical protein